MTKNLRAQITDLAQLNLAQMLGLVNERLWQESRSIYLSKSTDIFQVIGTPCKNSHLTLIYVNVISHLWFSISTKEKPCETE